eukprot:574310-Hanusia_phi.AAC.1
MEMVLGAEQRQGEAEAVPCGDDHSSGLELSSRVGCERWEREREGQRKRGREGGREGGSYCANDTMWLEIVIQGLEFKISDGWP